jgi:hypothetical protein
MRFCLDAIVYGDAEADADALADVGADAAGDAAADADADDGAASGAATMFAGAIGCGSFEHAASAKRSPARAADAHLARWSAMSC